jgi:hypothetical protein
VCCCLQEVLKAAADDKGEWYLPLDKEQVGAQQQQQQQQQRSSSSSTVSYLAPGCLPSLK